MVEDLPYNRLIINKILVKYQVHLKEVGNGQLAIDEWRKNKNYDLILMDMNMPVMDGFQAMKKIRSIPKIASTPIIALTAKAMKKDRDECIKAGANDYITKPVDIDKLLTLVRVWIRK